MRLLRGAFVLGLLLAIGLGIGSFQIRRDVIELLESRKVASASVVLGRAFPLSLGTDILNSHVTRRLDRLAFQRVSDTPDHAGQYQLEKGVLQVFLRKSILPTGELQREQLVSVAFSPEGRIQSISDVKFRQPLKRVWLEPEIISLLGNSSTRASNPRTLEDFPEELQRAVLAIEDERFYAHFGLDPLAVLRALVINIQAGRFVQGGSTITQQLAKNLFFTRERSLARKVHEALAAVLIETAFSKDQILEFYLNEVFLGQEGPVAIHGFGEAARSFFGKEVENITLPEAATLAAIIKGPTKYNPRRNPDGAKERRALVLEKMAELNFITEGQLNAAKVAELKVRKAQRTERTAPYFVDYVRKQLEDILSPSEMGSNGYQIHTGLDVEYEQCAKDAISSGLKSLETTYSRLKKKTPPVQAALVAISPLSAEVLAWVGGRSYQDNQFDRVSLAKRQPGSSFKPFVYLTAMDKQLNSYRVARTTSLLEDEPVSLEIPGTTEAWEPGNYDKSYRGEVTVRYALTHSLNIPTINLALKVGVDAIKHTAELMGFGENLPAVASLALGAGEVTPLELARAYLTLANGGLLRDIRPVVSVTNDQEAGPVWQASLSETRVASEPAVYVLTNILQSVVEEGTGNVVRRLGFGLPAAAKTGTTNDMRDAWFAGFTPSLLAVVWVGMDDNSELGLTGGQAAGPIWTEFMKCASPMETRLDFVPPPGVLFRRIDRETGLLETPDCPRENIVTEVFVEGTEPITPCVKHSPDAMVVDNTASTDPVLPGANILPDPPATRPHPFNQPSQLPPARERDSRDQGIEPILE